MIPIARPQMGAEELAAVKEVLESGRLVQGPKVEAFEKAFAAYLGRKHGIAVANGTAALQVALLAHGIGRGAEVVVPPLTFFASASTVLQAGAKPVFSDVERSSYNLDPAKLPAAMSKATRAIMPVHLYGQTVDIDPVLEVARDHEAVVIEDACQAHGAEYKGRKAGHLGDSACFSFYATKNMTTGEGGMVVTDDAGVAERARLLRDHGQSSKYIHASLGYNLRMTEIAAAIGLVQLKKLDDWVRRRRANAKALTQGLAGIEGLVPPAEGNWMVHAYYQYVVRAEPSFPMPRNAITQALTEAGVGSRASYPMPLYRQPALQGMRLRGRCPVAEDVVGGLFELPVHPGVSPADVDTIVRDVGRLAKPG